MTHPIPSYSNERREWLIQVAQSRTHILAQAKAGTVNIALLRRVADTEAEFTLALHPMPEDVVEHTRAAHAYARPYLERLLTHDPTREVFVDATHSYTPRKVLRRVLDHALDHLNQLEQWLLWQHQGVVPYPTDGRADSATTLEEDRFPLTSADLNAWLWRIDLVVELVAQRAGQLSLQKLDWMPPDGGWSLRQMLHHLASAEMYYAIWLDEELPEETVARYAEANRRFGEQVQQILPSLEHGDTAFFEAGAVTPTTIKHIVQEVLAAEHHLLFA
ncbi:MAG: DinB family protein [Ktedonobacteraceae bacterium]